MMGAVSVLADREEHVVVGGGVATEVLLDAGELRGESVSWIDGVRA